jgi:hypothetical protein
MARSIYSGRVPRRPLFDNRSFGGNAPARGAADVGFQDRARERLIELLEGDEQKPFREEVEREQQKIEKGVAPRTIDDIARRWQRLAKAARQQGDGAKVSAFKQAAELANRARSEA